MATYASMYGPYRQVVDVGPHTATGTTITLECGHQTTIVPHMSAQGMVGDSTPCVACKADATAKSNREWAATRAAVCAECGHIATVYMADPVEGCECCRLALEATGLDTIGH